jgi:MFS transporter, FHS family, glucose/mannose:H+ symporter
MIVMHNTIKVKLVVYQLYFIFAILLNSVGILIQRSINVYGVSESTAGNLEFFKDMSIAIVSFFIGSLLPKLGYKRGLLLGLSVVLIGCVSMYFLNSFSGVSFMFACTGFAFALVKVAVYAIISSVSQDEKGLNKFLTSVESVFMLGIAAAYFLFPLFYDDTNVDNWLRIYLLLAVLIFLTMVFAYSIDFRDFQLYDKETGSPGLKAQFKLLSQGMILVFGISAFFYVMVEQGIMSWLPTFNEKILMLPEKLSVNMAIILALSIALGRFVSGYISTKIKWIYILMVSLLGAAAMIMLVLPRITGMEAIPVLSFWDIPLIAFVFPLIGFFLAPIYPLMNSAILANTDKALFTQMAGLLTFFSALGGTLGSKIIGVLFQNIGGAKAFYFVLIPITLLAISLLFLYKKTENGK